MSKTIWKYIFGFNVEQEMPDGAEFLFAELQDGVLAAWFMVLPDSPKVKRRFKVYGTGHEIPMSSRYLMTFQQPPYVWHLFEESQSVSFQAQKESSNG